MHGTDIGIDHGHRMRLVADIGGTNARLALAQSDGELQRVEVFAVAEHAGIEPVVERYLGQHGGGQQLAAAVFALAGPSDGERIELTNSGWVLERSALRRLTGAAQVALINDFEALALALPHLGASDIKLLGAPALAPLTKLVLGPGTGLGVAACVADGRGGWVPLRSEGGHATLAAHDAFEAAIIEQVRHEHPHVSAERLVSGIGMPVLHQAIARVEGIAAPALDARQIIDAALAGTDARCARTLETFCALLGSVAGSLALVTCARGGVYLAGGIAQRLSEFLPRSPWRQRFEAKGRFAEYLAAIGTAVIVAEHVALRGCALAPLPQHER